MVFCDSTHIVYTRTEGISRVTQNLPCRQFCRMVARQACLRTIYSSTQIYAQNIRKYARVRTNIRTYARIRTNIHTRSSSHNITLSQCALRSCVETRTTSTQQQPHIYDSTRLQRIFERSQRLRSKKHICITLRSKRHQRTKTLYAAFASCDTFTLHFKCVNITQNINNGNFSRIKIKINSPIWVT